jgi:hypothetical protein
VDAGGQRGGRLRDQWEAYSPYSDDDLHIPAGARHSIRKGKGIGAEFREGTVSSQDKNNHSFRGLFAYGETWCKQIWVHPILIFASKNSLVPHTRYPHIVETQTCILPLETGLLLLWANL